MSSLEVTRAIQETSDRTAAAISAKGNSLVTSVIGMSERVGREIPVLLEKLGTEQTRLSSIIDGATRNLSALETALAEKTQSLGTTLARSHLGSADRSAASIRSTSIPLWPNASRRLKAY